VSANAATLRQRRSRAGESGVTIDLDRNSYPASSRVEMRVTNHTSVPLGFNPCTRSIERREGDVWVIVPEPGRVCTMQISLLRPHESRTGTTELPASLARGMYRLALTLTREDGGAPPARSPIRAVTAPFRVR
jgi:Big-like domain-containing protein